MKAPFIREGPIAGPCNKCDISGGLRIVHRFEALPIGGFSLAGQQMKVSARPWPYMVCDNCGAECRGKLVTE